MSVMEFIKEALMTIGLCYILDKVLKCLLMPFILYKRRMNSINKEPKKD